MSRYHIQPYRNKQIYADKELAKQGLRELCNNLTEDAPKDSEIVTARYISIDEDKKTSILSIVGIFNLNSNKLLEVTIIDNNEEEDKYAVFWH